MENKIKLVETTLSHLNRIDEIQKMYEHEILSIFNHLVKEEYVVDISNGSRALLIVTHKGNHQTQARISKLLKFLSASVVVPIIVALLTSVAYHILSYWFPWLRAA